MGYQKEKVLVTLMVQMLLENLSTKGKMMAMVLVLETQLDQRMEDWIRLVLEILLR